MQNTEKTLDFINKLALAIKENNGRAFFVGGCVRDEIMGLKSDDYDIEVYGIRPDKLNKILSNFGEVDVIGEKFGVFQVHGFNVDISMPRSDNKVGLKHQDFDVVVNPNMSFKDALSRRDFTINALMKDVLNGEIIDEFDGVKDIKNRIIRHVSDEHFAEDSLRVLRASRFAAKFNFKIDEKTKELCTTIDLKDLSAERILSETKKALLTEKPSLYFENLKEVNGLKYWFKELNDLVDLKQNPDYHLEDCFKHTMMVTDAGAKTLDKIDDERRLPFMFSCLCHDLGKATKTDPLTLKTIDHEFDSGWLSENLLKRIKADNFMIKYVKELSTLHMEPGRLYNHDSHDKKIFALFDESDFYKDLLLLKACDRVGVIKGPKFAERNDISYEDWSKDAINKFENWLKQPHLSGEDLIKAGIPESKELGEMLNKQRIYEYSNSFVNALGQLKYEFKLTSTQVDQILKDKGLFEEKREIKFLRIYQKAGYLKDVENPSSIKALVSLADYNIIKDFKASGRPACEYMDFLKEKLGEEFAVRHQRIIDGLNYAKEH